MAAGHSKEQHHHKGDAAGKAVDAVGQVHGVDAAHNHEGGEHQIQDPVDLQAHIQEWNVQLVAQQALIPHQTQKHHRRRQLQQELLLSGKALVLMLANLAVIIHKSDQAEDQRKQVYIQMDKLSVQHFLPPQSEHSHAGAQDEHDAAHGRGARLGLVPGGAVGPDLLSGFQLVQLRDQEAADHQRQHEGHRGRDDGLYHMSLPLLRRARLRRFCAGPLFRPLLRTPGNYFPAARYSATISRSSMWCFTWLISW